MGASSARIQADDFLTPPELSGRRLAANAAGRIGGVRLDLLHRAAGTYLGPCYQQVPLRVLPPFRLGIDQPALLYLLNPTAGLLDGDAQLVQLSAGPGSRAVVVGQSATRIHPCLRGFATQQWHIHVAAGAVLVVLPGPAIPFQGCHYYQHVAIDLAPEAGLVWGDLWQAGRYARGALSERFQFGTLIQDLQVHRAQVLIYRDRFCWRGPWDQATAAWHFGAAPACGSLFVTGSLSETVIARTTELAAAQFPTESGDTCMRWSGPAEAVSEQLVHVALSAGAALAGAAHGEPWLSGHDLAPTHWFSAGQSGTQPSPPIVDTGYRKSDSSCFAGETLTMAEHLDVLENRTRKLPDCS